MNDNDPAAAPRARPREPAPRRRAWRVAAITLLVVAGFAGMAWRVVQAQRDQGTLQDIHALAAEHQARLDALSARYRGIDLATAIGTDALARPDGVDAGRAVLRRYLQVLADEEREHADYAARSQRLMERLAHDPVSAALLGYERGHLDRAFRRPGRVFRAQRAFADAVGALFDCVGSGRAHLQVSGGHWVADSDDLQGALRERYAGISRASDAVQAAVAATRRQAAQDDASL
ncbi:MAG TPA: hypothetical protein VF453_00850 [Burkholderiaceae bacterium]